MEDLFLQIKKMVEESGLSWEEALSIMRIAFNAPIRVKIGDKEYLALCPLKPKEKDIPRGEVADRLMSEGWRLLGHEEREGLIPVAKAKPLEMPAAILNLELFFPNWVQEGFDRIISLVWTGRILDLTTTGRHFPLDPQARVLVHA